MYRKRFLLTAIAVILLILVCIIAIFSVVQNRKNIDVVSKNHKNQPTISSMTQAENLLKDKIRQEKVNNYWLNSPCVLTMSEERKEYYIIELHGKHTNGCPGTPGVLPLLAQFKVNKKDGSIFWYNIIHDKYIPFDEYIKINLHGK